MINTAKITSLTPDGRPPYQSSNGPLYGFIICFDNNLTGLVNSKSEVPPYRVGEIVGYEVTGKVGNKDKMKITRNMAPAQPQVKPAPVIGGSPASHAETVKPVYGATVGMAINQAVELTTKGMDASELAAHVETDAFWNTVWRVASMVISVSQHLEAGRLAKPRNGQENRPAVAPVPVTQPNPDDDIPF